MLVLLAESAAARLDRAGDVVSVLTPQQWQRAGRFRRPKDRAGFLGAHVAVRLCMAALTGGNPCPASSPLMPPMVRSRSPRAPSDTNTIETLWFHWAKATVRLQILLAYMSIVPFERV